MRGLFFCIFTERRCFRERNEVVTVAKGKYQKWLESENLVLSLLISIIVFLFSTPMLRLINVPDEMLGDADMYIKIVGGTIFTQAIINAFSQIFNNNGKTFLGMIIAFGMNSVNIIATFCCTVNIITHFFHRFISLIKNVTDAYRLYTSVVW